MEIKRVISLVLALVLVLNVAPIQGYGAQVHDHDHTHEHEEQAQETPEINSDILNEPTNPAATIPEEGMDVTEEIVDGVYHYSGVCGDDLTWKLNRETGVLTISGTGEMWDYAGSGGPWHWHRELINKVIVEEGVTSIGDYAFYSLSFLETLQVDFEIPQSVRSIGKNAIYWLFAVVHIEDLMTWITIAFHDDETHTPRRVAMNGEILYDLMIPAEMTVIHDGAFAGMSLSTVTIPDHVTAIGNEAFAGSSFFHAAIGSGVTQLGDRVFCDTLLKSIDIPDSVLSVGTGLFADCSYLTEAKLGRYVTVIDKDMFAGCTALTTVSIPDTIEFIDDEAFADCENLVYNEYEGGKYLGNEEHPYLYLVELTDKNITSFQIHPQTRIIKSGAFAFCDQLTAIDIPDQVIYIGDNAFQGCRNLQTVKMPATMQFLGEGAFKECTALQEVTIPQGVTQIGTETFYKCVELENISIPDSVTAIGDRAFQYCQSLTKMYIPRSVETLGEEVFDDCTSLREILVDRNNPSYSSDQYGILYNKDRSVLIKAPTMLKGDVILPETVKAIEESAFSGCSGMTALSIPDGVTEIGAYAFYSCSGLKTIQLGSGITHIAERLFYGCYNLLEIRIPEGVTEIGASAFASCSRLRAIWIPETVIKIDQKAFNNTASLWHVLYGGAYHRWDDITVEEGNGVLDTVTIHGLYAGEAGVDVSDQVCSLCASHTHQFTVIGDTATCTKNGYVLKQCDYCGELEEDKTQSVKAGHIWLEATCTAPKTCARCGKIDENVPALGHDAKETCTDPAICNRCGLKLHNAWGHDWDQTDCAAFKTCNRCGETKEPEEHLFSRPGYLCAKCQGDGSDGSEGLEMSYSFDAEYQGYFTVVSMGTCTDADIVIPSTYCGLPVREIGEGAFSGHYHYGTPEIVTSITIPESVEYVGEGAFSGCVNLQAVHVADMDAWCRIVFADATANPLIFAGALYMDGEPVKKVVVPDYVGTLAYTFSYCTTLEHIVLPEGIRYIGDTDADASSVIRFGAFEGCSNLKSIHLPEGLVWIADYGFADCTSLEEIRIPDSITDIGTGMFLNCSSLKKAVLSENLKSIGVATFYDCVSLETVEIPVGVTAIEANAFYQCSALEEITIPEGVTTIGEFAFYECTALTELTISSSVTSIGKAAFHGCVGLTELELPKGLETIGEAAFEGCENLRWVRLPETVTHIEGFAFNHCKNVETIYFGGTIAQWEAVEKGYGWDPNYTFKVICEGECIVNGHRWVEATCTTPKTCEYCGMIGGEALGHDYVDDFCTRCGEQAEPSEGLEFSIAFGECSVIGMGTCTDTVLRIPNYHEGLPVTRIDPNVFQGHTELTEVYMGSNMVHVSSSAFMGCTGLTKVQIGDNVKYIWDYAFEGCAALEEVILGEKLQSIGARAFYGCESLKSITIPDSVTEIGGSAFSGCAALETVNFGQGLESIGSYAFKECDALLSVFIPANVTSIGMDAFYSCSSLTEVVIAGTNTSIGMTAFAFCSAMTHLSIEGGTIGSSAFTYCSGLKRLDLGIGVTRIDSDAFSRCGAELEIYYAGNRSQWQQIKLGSGWAYMTAYTLYYLGECNDHDWVAATCTEAKYCKVCGTTEGEPLGHDWLNASCTMPPCCSRCGICEGEALGHDWAAATCTAPMTCTRCGRTEGGTLPHNYVEVTKQPTCTEDGSIISSCTVCADVEYSRTILALGHDWTEGSCTEPVTCSRCGIADGEALGHDWAEATCMTAKHCRTCGVTEGEPLDHCLVKTVVVQPTCTEEGYTVRYCQWHDLCGYTETGNYVSALGHDWLDANCTAPATCSRCGATEGEALGHNWLDATCTEPRTCSRCGATDGEALGHDLVHHDGKAPTCTEDGWLDYDTCTRCGYTTYKELKATGHNYSKLVTSPTCTEQGYTTYTCGHCGDSYAEDYVDALGHDLGRWFTVTEPSCTEEGLQRRYCGRCDYVAEQTLDPTGHLYKKTVTAPTCTEGGYTIFTCNRCDDSYRGDETEPLGHMERQTARVEATCTEDGYIDYACARCGGNGRREILPAGHHWMEATCTEAGYCRVCGAENMDAPALGHDHQPAEVVEPDCWSDGYTLYRCTRCRDSYKSDFTPRRGHLWKDATCTEPATCTDCGITDGEPLGHQFTDGICDRCGCMPAASQGLKFKQEGDHYVVAGIGDCKDSLVVIPETYMGLPVTGIGDTAFAYGNITGVVIPGSVKTIGAGAFAYCLELKQLGIGEGVETIGGSAFYNCYKLEVVRIPDSVTTIGYSAFRYCSMLKQVRFGKNLTQIANSAFEACVLEGDLEIPDGVVSIGDYAFRANGNLRSVTLGQSVATIGKGVFDLCRKMVCVTLPAGLTFVDQNAFSGCTELWHVLYAGTEEQWAQIGLGSGNKCLTDAIRHYNCTGDEVTDLDGKKCVICNCDHAYVAEVTEPTCTEQGYTTYVCSLCGDSYVDGYVDALGHEYGAWHTVLEPTCTEQGLERHECIRCGHPEEQTLDAKGHNYGETITEPSCTEGGYTTFTCHCGYSYVGDHTEALGHHYVDGACDRCGVAMEPSKGLAFEKVGDHYVVTGMGSCTDRWVVIPDTYEGLPVTGIAAYAFMDQRGIIEITMPKSITSIEMAAFAGCTGLTSVTISGNVSRVGDYAFFLCDGLTEVRLEEGVVEIGNSAFNSCPALSVLILPASLTVIEYSAFWRSDQIWHVLYQGTEEQWNAIDIGIDNEGLLNAVRHYECVGDEIAGDICDICNCAHDYTAVVTEPTCTEQGYTTHTCTLCGDSYADDYVDALGHLFIGRECLRCDAVDETFTDPDCGVDANTIYDRMMALQTAFPERMPWTNDDFYAWNGGVYYGGYGCAAFAFILSDAAFGSLPSRVFSGDVTVDRLRVGDILRVYGDSHSVIVLEVYEDYIVIAEGNYNSSIHWGRVMTAQEVLESTDYVMTRYPEHAMMESVTAPTCTEKGYTTHTCTACGDSYIDSYVDALGHEYGEWYVVTDANCTENGEKRHDCERCEHFETKVIEATGHSLIHHDAKAPTCTEIGWNAYDTCENCDYTTYVEIVATGHSYKTVVTDPTCTERGYTTHTCHCGDSYVDSYVDATGHHHEMVDSKEPTATEDGYETWRCPDCGDEYTETIPATGVAIVWGDVNGDGTVNYMDAYLIMRYSVGLITADSLDLAAADVNGDGSINYMDAYLVMRKSVGLIDKFPVE